MRRATLGIGLVGVCMGGLVAVAASHLADVRRHVSVLPVESAPVRAQPLRALTDAPATVLSGVPNFRAAQFSQSPDQRSSSGIWACDGPATFEWNFGADEVVYLLEGQVDVTYQGQHFTLRPGDTAVFHAGTQARWHVPNRVLKSYTLYYPSWLVRWLRRWQE